ncbi:YolD-like family protein [Staphylococcus succinus]|uniref:YolD-like family protein n=1 Tax=Staphylococcus succinus TaxID=61015 RepID=UPI000E6A8F27|nr:YolD-like family protein [Staphylococcus succinus]RIN27730.1 YolD-like family protein [Staphylococcus succinus]
MKVINPSMPEPYKYETDYRKIPSEYLNPRIPRGRGIKKWQPFKTMPEQYEKLEQYMEDQNKVDMPLLSQEQLEEINDKVNHKIKKQIIADLSYWQDGYVITIQCYINKVDELNGIMLVTNEKSKDKLRIKLSSIVNVE